MVTVSIVSHGHGRMVERLVSQLMQFPEVSQVLVTVNIAESIRLPSDKKIQVISNKVPSGFGANHNAAFLLCDAPYYCVLNPDVAFLDNPFPSLEAALVNSAASLVVPLMVNETGKVEDSLRHFLTPKGMLKRILRISSGSYKVVQQSSPFCPEWAGGMFMLFRSAVFKQLQGFDERYFMYCEDADICTRLWMMGGQLVAIPQVQVIHQAQRASRRSIRYLAWHVTSMIRYMVRFAGRLPSVSESITMR